MEALIHSLEDLNAHDKERELRALKDVPWDDDMRGQVWGDRGLLRWKMKKEMAGYRAFLERLCVEGEVVTSDDDVITSVQHQNRLVSRLTDFCRESMTPRQLYDIFQISRQDVISILQTKYKICSFATVVFCAVSEQLEHFNVTGLGIDAPNDGSVTSQSEVDFEKDIQFDSKRGFYINIATISGNSDDNEYTINNLVLEHFLHRMVTLAGPTLLTCSDKNNSNNSNEPRFHSDRRIIRLIIAKYWAEKIIDRFQQMQTNIT